MQFVRMKSLVGSAIAIALCVSPTMAAAATTAPTQSISPLIAVSVFGTQASAQTVCTQAASAAAAAGSTAVQGQPGCVLPVNDVPPPAPQAGPPPPPPVHGFGISPVILGLLGIAALAALIALGNDDDNGPAPVSPN
jgi:hypothetical protein